MQFFRVSGVPVSAIRLWSWAALLHPLRDCVTAVVVQMVTRESVFGVQSEKYNTRLHHVKLHKAVPRISKH